MSGNKTPSNVQRTCQRMVRTDSGNRHECLKPAVPVFVIGEFGRAPQYLCEACIAELRSVGWSVEFQLGYAKGAQGG